MISTLISLPKPTLLLLVILSSIIPPINSKALAIIVPDSFGSKIHFLNNQQAIQLAGLKIKEDATPAKKTSSPNIQKPLSREDYALLGKISRAGIYKFSDKNEFVEFRLTHKKKFIVFIEPEKSYPLTVRITQVDPAVGLVELQTTSGGVWTLHWKGTQAPIQTTIQGKPYLMEPAKTNPRRAWAESTMPNIMKKIREHEIAIRKINDAFIQKLNP
jgi:hypothetical protein